jgi:hypothetical protein
MAYITQYNFKRISNLLDAKKIINKDNIDSILLCEDLPAIKFGYLNKIEKQGLLAFKEFVLHPEIIFNAEYRKIKFVDTKRFVFEIPAAYHLDPECSNLHQDFDGIEIPDKIREQGDEKIAEFRQWYRENMHLLEEDKVDVFEMHLHMKFGIHRSEMEIIHRENSGSCEFENYSIKELCEQITNLTMNFKAWLLDSNDANEKSLRLYAFNEIAYKGKCTYLGDDFGEEKHLAEICERNKSKFTDQEIFDCLKEAHTKYKLPMIELLKKYYMIKYNADTKVDINILKALGFRPCSACCSVRELGSKYDWEDIEI